MKPVIIVAPQGAGKTRHADALMKALGCSRLVDSWDGVEPLQYGDLALTHAPIVWQGTCRVTTLAEAMEVSALKAAA